MKYFMPTEIIQEDNCIINNSHLLSTYGKKAMIVCGNSSAYKNGAYDDIVEALKKENINYITYDKIEPNPSINTINNGAIIAREHHVDFVIGIGGGSPMDACKAIALQAMQAKSIDTLFDGNYSSDVLPIICIPTTAGTGSEVTPYAIITNDILETKLSIATKYIFPKLAMLDGKYMRALPKQVYINTVFDALSHAIEGMFSCKANDLSNRLALESIKIIFEEIKNIQTNSLSNTTHNRLLYASSLAGMVISQTGTTVVHAMGYNLTYYKGIDHGYANAILMPAYLQLASSTHMEIVNDILNAMVITSLDEYTSITKQFFEAISLSDTEIMQYASKAFKTKNITNNIFNINESQIIELYKQW